MSIFNTPAFQGEKDFSGDAEGKQKFLDAWNDYVKFCTQNSQQGNPWSNKYDSPRSWYYNANETEGSAPTQENTIPIQWTAFPNRILHYFSGEFNEKFGADADDRLHELADIGPEKFIAKYGKEYDIDLLVPQNACNPDSPVTRPFGPAGPRGWQDEYCEWSVKRDAQGKITQVDFTHENPEYWSHMWRIDPDLVVSLYKEILENDNVKVEDLYLLDENNEPVIVRETGKPAYNPINKWNSGSDSTETSGGAVHLTSPPNTLGAEIYLGAAATILRKVDGTILTDANELICAAQYGQIFRNSDPRIGQNLNLLVNMKSLKVTLTNPIGLYGQEPTFSMFTMPEGANYSIEDCYSVVRGVEQNSGDTFYPNNMILHSRFKVPADANFSLSDIQVSGKPLNWGSQIADTFHVQLAGTGIPGDPSEKVIYPPVAEGNVNPPLPSVQYVIDYDVLEASLHNHLETFSNVTSCITQVEQCSTVQNIAVLVSNADQNTQLKFSNGVTAKVDSFQDLKDSGQLFIVSLTVAADAALDQSTLILTNGHGDAEYPIYGVLEVVAPGTLAPAQSKKSAVAALSDSHIQKLAKALDC